MDREKTPKRKKFRLIPALVVLALPWIAMAALLYYHNNQAAEFVHKPDRPERLSASADHSQFEVLQQDFESPHEVTEACMSCHTERHKEIMDKPHWLWERTEVTEKRGKITWGKANIINNFCVSITSNEPRCTSCHAGYGWEDQTFDRDDPRNVDCLVCHDNSGDYKKHKKLAGYPPKGDAAPDLNHVAQNVGKPTQENCGTCHFSGAGGNNVKHGDLETATLTTTPDVDVHMADNGADMQCTECHETQKHSMKGKLYTVSSVDENRATCDQCHTESPHFDKTLNRHTAKVSCQTCHIPHYAKENPTKMYWDWSTAGRLNEDGEQIKEKDENGFLSYMSKKGSFVYAKNVEPEYTWFNGTADHTLPTDKFKDTSEAIVINPLYGDYSDGKIIPMKVHRGKQIFDPVNNNFIVPDLFGGPGAYWKNFDWDLAAQSGMDSLGLDYSGEYAFVRTEMNWPVNHMVAPADQSLSCKECHSRNGRLENLDGFYMPGRNRSASLDFIGLALILLSLGGSLVHGLLRILRR